LIRKRFIHPLQTGSKTGGDEKGSGPGGCNRSPDLELTHGCLFSDRVVLHLRPKRAVDVTVKTYRAPDRLSA
jgi:hypothetical protein